MKITASDLNTTVYYFSNVRVFTCFLFFAFLTYEELAEIVKTRPKRHLYILSERFRFGVLLSQLYTIAKQ